MVELFEQWGGWFLPVQALAVALTAFVPPLPSEIAVVASGAMAAESVMSLWAVVLATTVSCLVGDLGLYAFFRYRLVRVMYRWSWSRRLHRGLLRTAIRSGQANTWIGLLLVRWVPGGRTVCMASAGMMRLGWVQTLALGGVGALTWTLWLVGLGYITGTTTGMRPLASTLTAIVVGTLVGLAIGLLYARGRRASTQVGVE